MDALHGSIYVEDLKNIIRDRANAYIREHDKKVDFMEHACNTFFESYGPCNTFFESYGHGSRLPWEMGTCGYGKTEARRLHFRYLQSEFRRGFLSAIDMVNSVISEVLSCHPKDGRRA